jgi:hypothetical protein
MRAAWKLYSAKGDFMEPIESPILLDIPEGLGDFERDFLEKSGHRTVVCHGPAHATLCPVLEKAGSCEMVDEAHGIVFSLDLDRPQHRAILKRYQEVVREDVPISVVVKEGQDKEYASELSGVHVWVAEATAGQLDGFAAEVDAADQSLE